MLPPLLDMKQAAPLADALLAARGGPVVVAAAAVERLGAQCLQVLLSARASWESDGHSFMLQNPSAPLRDALSLAGVAPSVFNCVQEPDA
jgi:chemotaxis protein CheX